MAKTQAILDLLPCTYSTREPGNLLARVVEGLAQPLEEADSHLFRIQRAHRVDVAEHIEDVLLLAAGLNLSRVHFADLLDDEALSYEERLRLVRLRIHRVARLHLEGTGTPWAAVEGAAIFLDAVVQIPEGGSRLETIDPEGFSHRAIVESDRGGLKLRDRIHLHENPRRRRKVDALERWPLAAWRVLNESVATATPTLVVRGIGDRTVHPAMICQTGGQGVLFHGVVPDGATLVVDRQGARLDGVPVDEWMTYFDGGIHDFSDVGRGTAVTGMPASNTDNFDPTVAGASGSPLRRPRPVPDTPSGRSTWMLQVAEGVFGGSEFDCSVFDTPPDPVGTFDEEPGFDQSVFYYPPSGVVGMAWNERIPCAFKLALPPTLGWLPVEAEASPVWELGTAAIRALGSADGDADGDAVLAPDVSGRHARAVANRIGELIPRFRAAGVRAFVEPAGPSWTLGVGVLRSGAARFGMGVQLESTELADPYEETLVRL